MERELKKYYVGAIHIGEAIANGSNAACMRSTKEAAIEEATKKVQGDVTNCAVVVKVVTIIRKAKPPIEVEDLE